MTLTVKLPRQLETELDARCRLEGRTRSDLVRRLVESYVADKPHRSPWELYRMVTGGDVPGSGRRMRGRDHSRLIKAKLRADRAR